MTIRPEGSVEELVLGQIYMQALGAAGYEVKRAPSPSFGVSTGPEAVKSGLISGYASHLSAVLNLDLGVEISEIPGDAGKAFEKTKAELAKQGLTAFAPAPFSLANAIGMLRTTAEAHGLKTDSDLEGKAEKMTVRAETYCHVSLDCLGGLEAYYGTAFKSVSYETTPSVDQRFTVIDPHNLRYKVLENGEFDASMLFTTEGRLIAEKDKFVILEDDKHLFPAGNAIWVTSPKVVKEAGPEYERTIVAAQKGLTLPVVQRLDAKVELEGQSPTKVAAAYLKEAGLID